MKKMIRYLVCALVLTLVLPLSVAAVHEDMTWQKLDAEDTFDAPYEDYQSVFDNTKEKYPFNEMEEDLFLLQEQFPDLMRLEVIGYSEFGRPLYAVVMGSDYAPNRMLVLADAHAREYATTQMAILQLEYYLHNYDNTINGEKVSDLFDRCQYYFIPMLNPDGAMISMEGLASLNDPRLTLTAEEKAEIKAFMLSQVDQMNAQCEADVNYHDTDANLYSANPNPNRSDAFQYWKSNGKGIDLHYSMFNPYMLNRWQTSGSWYSTSKESHFSGPHWENATGYVAGGANNTDNGIYNSAENAAFCDYVNKIQPNMFTTYHTASNIVQWDYGYGQMENPNEKRAVGKEISYKASDLLNFKTSDTQNPYIGHAGWFMLNSQNYMDNVGYGVTIEWASRQYLNSVGGRVSNYMDAPPTQIIQLMTDVKTDTGVQKYSLWTTGRFFPMALSQYIMDNHLIDEVEPIAEKASFADVPSSYWARPQIERAFQDGAINGTTYDYTTSKRTYGPENTLTLAHFVAITTRAFYAEDVAASTATGTWYAANEAVAKANGLLEGLGDVNMTAPASRYQMAAIMANIMKDKGADMPTAAELTAIQSEIADWNVIPEQYKDAVATVFALGIINGTDAKGTFAGNNSVKRSHAAAVYCRLKDAIADNEAAAKAAAAPASAVKTIAGKAVAATKVSTMNVGPDKTPVVVEDYGTVVLDKAGAATLTAADFQGASVTLYNGDFQAKKDSAYVGNATPIRFTYKNGSETVYATVSVTRPVPVSSVIGAAVKVGDMSIATDKATAAAPSALVGADGAGTILLPSNIPSVTAANVKAAAGYTVTLYTDDTFSAVAASVALEIGKNDLYIGVANAATGDQAFYTATVKNPARPDDAGLRAKQDGGIWRTWELDKNAGTKADPDIVYATVNAAYFGTTNTRSFSNIAEKLHDNAVVKYYTDNTFTTTCSNYTFAGGWENGMRKEAYFSITAADGKTIRYYTFVITSAQDLASIDGKPVKYLGMKDPTKANGSQNPMCVEVTLSKDQCTSGLVPLPRYTGQLMGKYPNIKHVAAGDGTVLQAASIVVGGKDCPEGYDAYYKVTVRSPWTSQGYFQVNVKFK